MECAKCGGAAQGSYEFWLVKWVGGGTGVLSRVAFYRVVGSRTTQLCRMCVAGHVWRSLLSIALWIAANCSVTWLVVGLMDNDVASRGISFNVLTGVAILSSWAGLMMYVGTQVLHTWVTPGSSLALLLQRSALIGDSLVARFLKRGPFIASPQGMYSLNLWNEYEYRHMCRSRTSAHR